MQNLRSISNYASSFWDWTFLNGCFGLTKIKVSDIDGVVERNGHFLVIETKKPNEAMGGGQKIMYERLTQMEPFTLLVIVGEVNIPQRAELWTRAGIQHYAPATIQTIQTLVTQWFDTANRTAAKPPTRLPDYLTEEPASALQIDWRFGVRCGINGRVCKLCRGVPCAGSVPLTD